MRFEGKHLAVMMTVTVRLGHLLYLLTDGDAPRSLLPVQLVEEIESWPPPCDLLRSSSAQLRPSIRTRIHQHEHGSSSSVIAGTLGQYPHYSASVGPLFAAAPNRQCRGETLRRGWRDDVHAHARVESGSQEDVGTRRNNALTLRLCLCLSAYPQTQLPDAGRRVDPLEAECPPRDITFELIQPPPGPVRRILRGRSGDAVRQRVALAQPIRRKARQQRLAVREQPDGRGSREPERRGA